MLQTDRELFGAIIGVALVVIILSLAVVLAIINYKQKQASYFREKKLMEEEFQRQLLQSQIEVQESTMSTLGQELHDNVGQLLSSAKMLLGAAERQIIQPPDSLITASATISNALQELRMLSKVFNKEWLSKFDLIENLEREINRLNTAQFVSVQLINDAIVTFGSEEQIILFRILQESLQNAIKHASAKNIAVHIAELHNNLTITITDDGCGFDTGAIAEGIGIMNMKHRVNLLGGQITFNSSAMGSAVCIHVPTARQ